jgi:hypothetical protein
VRLGEHPGDDPLGTALFEGRERGRAEKFRGLAEAGQEALEPSDSRDAVDDRAGEEALGRPRGPQEEDVRPREQGEDEAEDGLLALKEGRVEVGAEGADAS